MTHTIEPRPEIAPPRLAFFERYLSLWVGMCMAAGILAGKVLPSAVRSIRSMEFGQGSQINVPIRNKK